MHLGERVFIYRHPVDMRKQIDGRAALIATELGRNPADRSMYVFCNRGRDKLKLLLWHLNGYYDRRCRIQRAHLQPDRNGTRQRSQPATLLERAIE